MWRRSLAKASGMPGRRSMALVRDAWAGSGVDQISNILAGAEDSNGCETGWIGKEGRVGQLRFNGGRNAAALEGRRPFSRPG